MLLGLGLLLHIIAAAAIASHAVACIGEPACHERCCSKVRRAECARHSTPSVVRLMRGASSYGTLLSCKGSPASEGQSSWVVQIGTESHDCLMQDGSQGHCSGEGWAERPAGWMFLMTFRSMPFSFSSLFTFCS